MNNYCYCFAIRNVPEIIRIRGCKLEKPLIGDGTYVVSRWLTRGNKTEYIDEVAWIEKRNVEAWWIEREDADVEI